VALQIYLDTCVYNRPFDDQTQPRVWLETLAFSIILQMVEEGSVVLVTSAVIAYENSQNPDTLARSWVERCVQLAQRDQPIDEAIQQRAIELEQHGLRALDALHVACAEAAKVDYFITCDDRLRQRYRRSFGTLQICTPVEFVQNVMGEG